MAWTGVRGRQPGLGVRGRQPGLESEEAAWIGGQRRWPELGGQRETCAEFPEPPLLPQLKAPSLPPQPTSLMLPSAQTEVS